MHFKMEVLMTDESGDEYKLEVNATAAESIDPFVTATDVGAIVATWVHSNLTGR